MSCSNNAKVEWHVSKKKKHAIIKNSYFWASIAEASTISFTDGGEMCLNLIPCDKEIN